MSKMKSHSGAKKRFKKTGSGGVKHAQSHRRHILTKKSTKRKRQLRPMAMLSPQDAKTVTAMIAK